MSWFLWARFLLYYNSLSKTNRAVSPRARPYTFLGGFMKKILALSFYSILPAFLAASNMGCMAHGRVVEVRAVEVHDEKWHYEHDHDYNWKLLHHYDGPETHVSTVTVIHEEK